MRILKRLGTPFTNPVPPEFQKLSEKRDVLCESIYKAYRRRGPVKISPVVEDIHRKGRVDMVYEGKAYFIRLAQPTSLRRRTDMRHMAQIVTCAMMSGHEIKDGSIIYVTESGRAQISTLSSLSPGERQKLEDLVKRDWDILIKQWHEKYPPAC